MRFFEKSKCFARKNAFPLIKGPLLLAEAVDYRRQEGRDNQHCDTCNQHADSLAGTSLPLLEDDTPYIAERYIQCHEDAEREGDEVRRILKESLPQ